LSGNVEGKISPGEIDIRFLFSYKSIPHRSAFVKTVGSNPSVMVCRHLFVESQAFLTGEAPSLHRLSV